MVYESRTNSRWQYVPWILQPFFLTYNNHHGALCLLIVYVLYGRSRRILGVLFFIGMGSIVTTLVGRLPLTSRLVYAYPDIFLMVYQSVIILKSE